MIRFRTLLASIVTILIVGAAPIAAAAPAAAQLLDSPFSGRGIGSGFGLDVSPGLGLRLERGPRRNGEGAFETAAASCSGAAEQAAAQTGGQVLSVSSREQGGQTVCVVTLLVPGKEGGRPRKTTVTIRP